MASRVSFAEYGKDNVRIYKVHRDAETGVHDVTEMTVCCLLQGDIEASYTRADNSVIVATDSIKNTIYIKAKEAPVTPPELFAATLGTHFLDTYAHITGAHISIVVHRWARMVVDGRPHPYSFFRDSDEKRTVEAVVRRDGIDIKSGLDGLTVLKSTGSAFHGFVHDDFATLADTWDRILSTVVDCAWSWKTFADAAAVRDGAAAFDRTWTEVRDITMATFANDVSASVQNTMYKMCDAILAAAPAVAKVCYALPNKHYFEIDLAWHKGIKNTHKDAEVYAPQAGGPNGLIKCEVSRS